MLTPNSDLEGAVPLELLDKKENYTVIRQAIGKYYEDKLAIAST